MLKHVSACTTHFLKFHTVAVFLCRSFGCSNGVTWLKCVNVVCVVETVMCVVEITTDIKAQLMTNMTSHKFLDLIFAFFLFSL